MIAGGYNIIDFEGKEFTVNQIVTVDSSIVDKLRDMTKPCVVGNFEISSESSSVSFGPTFTGHYIDSGHHTHAMPDIVISVTGDNTIKFGV